MANMSSIRFFSLEPLQLDLIANQEGSRDDSLQFLSTRLVQMHELDFTNEFRSPLSRQSVILEQVGPHSQFLQPASALLNACLV